MGYAPNEQTSIPYIIWGFPEMGGTPIAGWFIMENTNLKWMRTGGTPMTQETSVKYTLLAVAVGGSEAIPMSDKGWDASGSLVTAGPTAKWAASSGCAKDFDISVVQFNISYGTQNWVNY